MSEGTRHPYYHAVPNIPPLDRLSFRDNTELIRVEEQVYRLRAQLDDRFLALEKSQSDSRIMKAFTDLVEQGKQQFNAELKALMPDIKLNESGQYIIVIRGKARDEDLSSKCIFSVR